MKCPVHGYYSGSFQQFRLYFLGAKHHLSVGLLSWPLLWIINRRHSIYCLPHAVLGIGQTQVEVLILVEGFDGLLFGLFAQSQ